MSLSSKILDEKKINLGDLQKFKDYKFCNDKLTMECYGLAHREYFHGTICKHCFNYKQLIAKREKYGKFIAINSNLTQYQTLTLFNALNSSQRLKLSGMLTPQQQLYLKDNNIINLNDESDDELNNTSEEDLNTVPKNERKDEPYNISNNDQKHPTSTDNSPKLESYRKPTLKLVTSC
jgi:hypothetical protein